MLALSCATYAADFNVGGLSYTVNADDKETVTLSGYNRALTGTLKIPSSVTYRNKTYTVTAIGDDAFLNDIWWLGGNSFKCSAVVIPSTVKTIGMSAFKNRTTITSVTFGEGLELIGAGAFEGNTNLSSITLPKSLKVIEAHAFKNCPNLCDVTVLSSPAILSGEGCRSGEASHRDHCDWFNSRNEDCQKLRPPQNCSHCADPKLTVPIEYYEEYFKDSDWNYEFENVYCDFEINDCLHLQVADKVYDGMPDITVDNLDFNQTCDYFSDDFLRSYIFDIVSFTANGVEVGSNYEATVTIKYNDKVVLPPLANSTISGTYSILPKTLTFDGDVVVADRTYDGTTDIDPSSITLPNLVGIVGDDDVRLVVDGTPRMSSPDVNVSSSDGLNVIPSIKVRLVGSKAKNYVLESDEILNTKVRVKPRSLNVTCDNISISSKVYDGKADFKKKYFTLPEEFGLIPGDKLTMEPVASAPSANVGEYNVTIGIYFTGDDQLKANYGVSKYNKKNPYLTCTKTLKITPKKITNVKYDLSVANHVYDCSFDDKADVTLSNVSFGKDELCAGDAVSLIVKSATLTDKNVTGSETSTKIVLELVGNSSGNYLLELNNDGIEIRDTKVLPAVLAITGVPNAVEHIYDGTTNNAAEVSLAGVSLTGFSCDDTASPVLVSSSLSQKNASLCCGEAGKGDVSCDVIVKFSGASLQNYTIDGLSADGTYTFKGIATDIAPRTLTVDMSKTVIDDKVYDGKKTIDPNSVHFSATIAGVVPGDDVKAEFVSATMGTKTVGSNLVRVDAKLVGRDVSNYALNSCADTMSHYCSVKVTKRQVNFRDLDLIVDSYPFNCGGSMDVSISAKLPDESEYLQYDENGTPDEYHIEADNVVFYKNWEGKYVATITLKFWGNDQSNYEFIGSNQFTEDIEVTAKDDVVIDRTNIDALVINHVFDCSTDVTEDYTGPKRLEISGLCNLGTSKPDVYYEFMSAYITDNANVGEKHPTKLVFVLAGSDLTNSNFDKSFYGLEDQIDIIDKATTRVLPASLTPDFSSLPSRMTHAYDGTNKFTSRELSSYSLSPVSALGSCDGLSYELESVVIDKSDVCDDAVATLSYKLKNASSSALTNYGLTSLTITKTIPTSITPKELQVNVTMPSCHVFDGKVNVSAAELIAKLSKIASPDGVLDDVRLTLVSATLDDPNVGDNHTLTIKYALAGDKAKNYTLPNGGVFVIKNVEVCAKELEVKGSLVFNDHVYDCGTNAKADVASYPYVELGTKRVYLQFSTDDYAIITNKNCGERTVNTRLHLVGLPNYKLKGGVGENGDMIILSEPIRITKRPLTLDGLGKATNHEYDCSKTYNGSITVPGLSNVSCSENVSLRVVSSVFSQVPDTQGPHNLTVTYDLDGAASVISNYYLVDNKQVLQVLVSPKTVTVQDPVFDTPLSHKFECGNPDDVRKEYLEIYPEELEVIGYCGDNNNSRLFFRLQSAKITDADKTPGDGRETTVVYKLDCDDAFNISNYVGLERNREFKISTNILKPVPASYVEPLFTPVSHQYVCGETGDVTYEFKNSKFAQIKVSGVCDYVVSYVLESAQVIDKDLTPSDNLKTRVVYKLVANSAEFDPDDFSLPASITYETALTNITKPAKATFSWPLFSPVPHQYICDGETGDVTNEFMAVAAYNRIPVSGVCGQDVYYQLVKAQIYGSDFTPSDNKKTTLTYSLVIPAGYDADDFGLSPNVVYAEALTNVTKPDPAQFIKPVFTPVDHKYVCAENGDVTADYLKTPFKSILVSNVCGQMASYELKSATVISSDLTPASNLPTRVVYEINMPVGYDHDMYGLAKTLTYSDARTNITKPDPAVVSSPVFAPVAHVFECNDNGDVTSEYKKQYGSIDISDICGYHAQYVLESAQIIGGEFTPKDGRPTKVVYRLVMPTGYDADDYGLDQVISFSDALTNVLKPEPAKFGRPDFSVVNVPYQCDFDGNVAANYAEAGYGVINVTGVCGSDVKYVLDEAHILGSDFSPAEGLQTKVRYILSAPSGFNPDIYGLANSLNFDNATSTILKPTPAFVELPSFVAVDHKYVCGEDGDVTADYLKSRFATVRVSDICGKPVYYKLRQATVMSSDLTPADALPTTVLYELVMPQGFDAEDFGLKSELYMTDALTNITKPDPASFTKPTFFAVKHKYACDDDGVVTNDFKSTSLNRIDVNGVCDAEVYYEIEKAEISDKSNLLPAAGVHTTVTYSLHYPQDFDPADFSLESTLVYYDALTDITPSDDAKFEAPVFNVVNHQFKCGETGVVTDEYKAIAGINKLFVSGICRDDVYYEIESAVVSDKSDLTPADNLPTTVVYKIHPSDFNYDDFGLKETLVYNNALTNITKPEPAKFVKPIFTPVRHQYVCDDSGDVTKEFNESQFARIVVSGVCGQSPVYRLVSAVVFDVDKTPGENRLTDVVYQLEGMGAFDPEDFGLSATIVYRDALTTITNPAPAKFTKPVFTAVNHKYQCPESGDVTAEYVASSFKRIDVSDVCDADVYYEIESAFVTTDDKTPASALPTSVTYRLHYPAYFVPSEFGLAETVSYDDAITNITRPDDAEYQRPNFAPVDHKFVCRDNGNVTDDYLLSVFKSIPVSGVCGGGAFYQLVNAQIAGADFTPATNLPTTLFYKLVMPEGQDAEDYNLAETLSFSDALTNVTKPEPASFDSPVFAPVAHQYQCDDNGDVTLQYRASPFGKIPVYDVCGQDVFYEIYRAQVNGSDFTPADNMPTTVYYRLSAPSSFDPEDFNLDEELVFNNAITNITKPEPADYTEPKFEPVEHRFACGDNGDVTQDFINSGFGTIEVSGICDASVRYRLVSAQILGSDFTPADGLATRVHYELEKPDGYNPADFGIELSLTFDNAITNIAKPEKPTVFNPVFTPIGHQWHCGEDGDVTEEYSKSGFNAVKVSDICGNKVYYRLVKAQVSSTDLSPANGLTTIVEYELVMPEGFEREDFHLEERLVYTDAVTDMLKPAPASFVKPAFTTVHHAYDCADNGDVTPDYLSSAFNEIPVSGVCGQKVVYSLVSARISGGDFTPAENLSTEVTYQLVMPSGFNPADFGLKSTIKFSDALTTVDKPQNAKFDVPVFTPVVHKYLCNDNGDVTEEFKESEFRTIKVYDICADSVSYKLVNAQILGSDFSPASGRDTKVVYRLDIPSGFDADDFGLDTVIVFNNALTDVTKPDVATFQRPLFATLVHHFSCDDNGDVTPEYSVNYGTIEVSGVCGMRVYYQLDSACIVSSDLSPALELPTRVYYSLVMPSGYRADDYGLKVKLVYDDARTSIAFPDPAVVTDPSFTPVARTYSCDWDGDVTNEYLSTSFAQIHVSDICGNKVSYNLISANVTSSDLTPASGVPTTLVYKLDMPDGYDPADFGLSPTRTYVNALTDILKPAPASFQKPDFSGVKHQYVCGEDGNVLNDFISAGFKSIRVDGVCCDDVRYELVSAYIVDADKTPADNLKTELVYNLVMPCGDPEDFDLLRSITYSDVLTTITKPEPAVVVKPVFASVTHKLSCDLSGDVTADYQVYNRIAVNGVCGESVSYVLKRAYLRAPMAPALNVPTTVEYVLDAPSGFDPSDFGLALSLTYDDALTDVVRPDAASFRLPSFTPVDHLFDCSDEDGDVTEEYLAAGYDTIPVFGICGERVYYKLTSAKVEGDDFTPADGLPTIVKYHLVIPSAYRAEDYGLELDLILSDALTNILKPAPAVFSKPAFTPVTHNFVCHDDGDVTAEYKASSFAEIKVAGICDKQASYQLVSATIQSADLTPADNLPTVVTYQLSMPEGYDAPDFGLETEITFYDALTDILKPEPATSTAPVFDTVDHQYLCNETGDVLSDYLAAGYGSIRVAGVCDASPSYQLVKAQVVADDLTPADALPTTLVYSLINMGGYDASDFSLANQIEFNVYTNITKPEPATFAVPVFTAIEHQWQCGEDGNVTAEYKNSVFASFPVLGVCNMSVVYKLVSAQIDGSDFLPADGLRTTVVYELYPLSGYDPDDYGLQQRIILNTAITDVTRPQPAHIALPGFVNVNHKFSCDDDGDVTADYVNAGFGSIPVLGICGLDVSYRLVKAQIADADLTPADNKLTNAEYALVMPEGYRPDDYGLSRTLVFDTLLTNVTLPDRATFQRPEFTAVNHKYECGDDGDVTSDYLLTDFKAVAVSDICGHKAYYQLCKAAIMSDDVTPADGLPTKVVYTLVMPNGYDAADYQLSDTLVFLDAITNVTKPDSATFDLPNLPEIHHTFSCSSDVSADFDGVRRINVSGICGTLGGEVYYEFESANIIGDEFSPSPDPYRTRVVYTLRGISSNVDIDDYDLSDELIFDEVVTYVSPKSVVANCHETVELSHTFDCSDDVLLDVASEFRSIDLPSSEFCGDAEVSYELVSAKIADDESNLVGSGKRTTLTYKLAGLDSSEISYYSLDEYMTCEAVTEVKAAQVGFEEPNVPTRLRHRYDCSFDVRKDYIAAGGDESVTVVGLCGVSNSSVSYELVSATIVSDNGECVPSVSLYKTIARYELRNISAEGASMYGLPLSLDKETRTEVISDELIVDCPSDLDSVIKHVYDAGADVTADYKGDVKVPVSVCGAADGTVNYVLSSVRIDDVSEVGVGNDHPASAVFTLVGLSEDEMSYYTLPASKSCATMVDVTPATLTFIADAKIVGRDYNGSKFINADIVTLPTVSYISADGDAKNLPLGALELISAEMKDKDAGMAKEAIVKFELTGDYAENFRFDNADISYQVVVGGIEISKLLVSLDGKPALRDKVNDGTVLISKELVTLPGITNVQSDDDNVLDELVLEYDDSRSFINETDYEVGSHTATIALSLSGSDAHNYELAPDTWDDLDIQVLPVSLSISGDFTTSEQRVYNAKRSLDVSKITIPQLLFPDGTPVDTAVAKIVITKALMDTKDAGLAKSTTIEYEISNTNFTFVGGATAGSYTAMTVDNAKRLAILTPAEPAFPAEKVYDCSVDFNMRAEQVIDNVQADEAGNLDHLSLAVTSSVLDDPNVGMRNATYSVELAGADKHNYYLAQDTWTSTIDVTPLTLSLDSLNVKLDEHVYDCSSDVLNEFADRGGLLKITSGLAACDNSAYFELVSAKLNDSNVGSRRTTLTFELRNAAPANYAISNGQMVYVVETKVLPAVLDIKAGLTLPSVVYNGSADITDEFAATGQVPEIISGLTSCDDQAHFELVSAKLDDPTPGTPREVELVFTLSGANGKNYGLVASDTVYKISTTVTTKPLSLRGVPQLPHHVYDASIDVASDFIVASIPVVESACLNDDISLSLISATLDDPNVGSRHSTLVFALDGADAWKYHIPGATFVVETEVTPRPVSLNGDAQVAPRGYDATSDVPADDVTLPTISGVLAPDVDNVALSLIKAKLDDSAIGHRLATLHFELVGSRAYNYVLSPDTVSVPTEILDTRTLIYLNGDLIVDSRIYDATTDIYDDQITLPTLSGVADGDRSNVSLVVESAYFDAADAGGRIATVVVKLDGLGSDFYKLENYDLTAESSILKKEVALDGEVTVDSRREDGTLDIDNSLIHLPGLDGVMPADDNEVRLVVSSALLDSASVGIRVASIALDLDGTKAHNYILVGSPVSVKVLIRDKEKRHGNVIPRYYTLEGRYVGEGKDFVITTPGLYIRLTGRHAERILVR